MHSMPAVLITRRRLTASLLKAIAYRVPMRTVGAQRQCAGRIRSASGRESLGGAGEAAMREMTRPRWPGLAVRPCGGTKQPPRIPLDEIHFARRTVAVLREQRDALD